MDTLFVGKNRITLDHIDSTNKYLANHPNLTELVEGTMVVAEVQSQGKGQRSNVWHSEYGKNMLVSTLLRPVRLQPDDFFILNKGVTLAVLNTVEYFINDEVHIKWPNDTLVGGKKIAGLLVELFWRANKCSHAIIGLGLNVNQLIFEGLPNATSLALINKVALDVDHVIDIFCQNLEFQYLQLKREEWDSISLAYNQRLWARGSLVSFTHKHQVLKGTIGGVANNGKLIINIEGKILELAHGDVSIDYSTVKSSTR